jgi:hypothetical protein
VVVAVAVLAKHAAKVKVLHVHRAMARHPRAEMVPKVGHDLKAKAMAAAKVGATVVAVKSSAAIHVLTTVATVKAVPHHAVHGLKDAVPVAALKVGKAVKGVVKTAAGAMATNCHATLTL